MKTLPEILATAYSNVPIRPLEVGECQTIHKKRCMLCFSGRIDYGTEIQRKQKAIDEYWSQLTLPIRLEPLISSPAGRHYRSVSKRKAFLNNKVFSLGLIGVDDGSSKNFSMNIDRCVIEPQIHNAVYRTVQEYLQRKENFSIAEEFNYVIVKGSDAEAIVIFNMNHFSSSNRKEVNYLSKYLSASVPNISGIFVYMDEERSRYYLSSTPRQGDKTHARPLVKIFGKDRLFHKVHTTKFLYSPLSFTQTNHSILDRFTSAAGDLLELTPGDTLYDLYCGYGLFSLRLSPSVGSTIGIEVSRSSVNDANENIRINKITNAKFIAADITPETLQRLFGKNSGRSVKIILDPPRSGTAEGVIEAIADNNPERVIHIFCNPDIVGRELQRWKDCGYAPLKAQPFDMFPGTGEIEIMVYLSRKSGRKE